MWFLSSATLCRQAFPPVTLKLADALEFTIGFSLKFNFATVLGVVAAIWGYRRL